MQYPLLDLEAAISAGSVLSHQHVNWQHVHCSQYLIHQRLQYDYPGPISDLHQRLMILPPELYGDQHRLAYRFDVSVPTDDIDYRKDSFGNIEITLTVPSVDQSIVFEAWVLVARTRDMEIHTLPTSWLHDPRLLEPSALTQPDQTLRKIANELLASGLQGLALAQQINIHVYHSLRYAHATTTIHTGAAEALAGGQGVCQDYAHIMLALCRLCGLPARYVSGHMLGEGGTHAWVEVILPHPDHPDQAQAIAFDPTHGRQTNFSYLTISVGRDYYDVAPTSGTFRAGYRGELSTRKQVDLILLKYADV